MESYSSGRENVYVLFRGTMSPRERGYVQAIWAQRRRNKGVSRGNNRANEHFKETIRSISGTMRTAENTHTGLHKMKGHWYCQEKRLHIYSTSTYTDIWLPYRHENMGALVSVQAADGRLSALLQGGKRDEEQRSSHGIHFKLSFC